MTNEERQELVNYRLNKAKETLNEIPVHIENQLWNTAINRLYYACFYAVSALLVDKAITSKTHAGTKQMFGLHFIKPGTISEQSGDFYTVIFDLRQTGDYDDFVIFENDEVATLLPQAHKLLEEIQQILSKE